MGLSPSQRTERWQRGMNNSTQNMKQGVEQLTDNPMELAAKAEDRWAAGVQRAREEGRFRDGCQSVSAQTWKDRYIRKGIPRIADGVAQAKAVMDAFATWHQPICDGVKTEARQMKQAGQDGRARMNMAYDRTKGQRFIRPRV